MNNYTVKQIPVGKYAEVSVPASKSILNRALVLSALAKGTVRLKCGSFAEDTRAALGCLNALGIATERSADGITVHGCGGNIPDKNAELDVKSAGTAARFLTVALAFCGGDYKFTASEQMKKRPMDVLGLLERAGVKFEFYEEREKFPFRMISEGIEADALTVDTDKSSQYASGLLLSAGVRGKPTTLALTGARTDGSYIGITLQMLSDFHIPYERKGNCVTVFPATVPPTEYSVEADVSGACYFFALALLLRARILVRNVRLDSVQGDVKFLRLLEERGLFLTQTPEGLLADGTSVSSFAGFDADFRDFSDQTLTAAALAPFASSPSVLRNVGHIRFQECDRINAICENLGALGVPVHSDGENVFISPAPVRSGNVRTFGDHRVAMAFSLIGARTGGITIDNPECCKKTFENYFEILSSLTE